MRPAQRDNEVDGLDEPTVVILVDGLYRLDMGRHGRVLPFGVYLAGWSWNRNTNTIGNWIRLRDTWKSIGVIGVATDIAVLWRLCLPRIR